ncbi:MAG TPA: DUF4349 domain-containing protein [Candidatus Hydrogenedentes bacterium]|nr:DUF4349 domain-containing protein [Candidatus Hydrogenedentota bacterium]
MIRKSIIAVLAILCIFGVLTGCKHKKSEPCTTRASIDGKGDVNKVQPERMLIWTAYITVEVHNVQESMDNASAAITQSGGYVEENSSSSDGSVHLRIRIPSKNFNEAVGFLEKLGKVKSKTITGQDVTEEYIDVEARLKNKIALRDSLKQLLEKAVDVKDILAIETELNRVQADVDSMEGRIKSLKEKVDFATITLSLERGKILGPFGYLFKGLWWGIEKLFVIRK